MKWFGMELYLPWRCHVAMVSLALLGYWAAGDCIGFRGDRAELYRDKRSHQPPQYKPS